uniref:Uncharacterized protein n=1 Tax=Anguilla anguilla TaxID=7936 RepID=A0A0E9U295_ANGAN
MKLEYFCKRVTEGGLRVEHRERSGSLF